MEQVDMQNFKLDEPCKKCGSEFGKIESKTIHQELRCYCGTYIRNVSKKELGMPQRHINTRDNIKPSKKAKIFERDNGRCRFCGKSQQKTILHVSHIISVKDFDSFKESEEWSVDDDMNLMTLCEECNLGMGSVSLTSRMCLTLEYRRKYILNHADT